MSNIKMAFAQILYKPAFFYNQNDLLVEPFGDEITSISRLSYLGSDRLREDLRKEYVNWIKMKIIAIIKKAIELNVKILVFPEYSIPSSILCDIVYAINGNTIIIIAGTHIITNSKENLPKGYPEKNPLIGYAICPIIDSSGVKCYTIKTHRAAEEIENIRIPKTKVQDIFDFGNYELQVKICIDAITDGESLIKKNNKILAIPSMSTKIEPFQALGILSKYNDIPIIYANNALTGGSMIYGSFSQKSSHWFVEGYATKPIPKNVECLVTASIDIDNKKQEIGTVHITNPISVNDIVNIFYRNDETHKKVIDSIHLYLQNFESEAIDSIPIIPDALFAEKMRILQLEEKNGLLIKENAIRMLNYIKINTQSFEQFIFENANKALGRLSAVFAGGNISDTLIIHNIAKLSEFINRKQNKNRNLEEEIFNDDSLFLGRDDEVAMLGKFIDSTEPVIILSGIRGIGKTKLISKISTNVLPNPSPWEIVQISIDKGIGYELLLDIFEYSLKLHYIERRDETAINLAKKMYSQIENMRPTIIILDDIHNLTDVNGIFSNSQCKDFILEFIRRISCSSNIKLIMTSSRMIIDISSLIVVRYGISRLSDDIIRFIIGYCYKKVTRSTKSIEIKDGIINTVYGNPLAAIIVAQLVGNNKIDDFENKGDLFRRFQERHIMNLIGEVNFTETENLLLKILSIAKATVKVDFVKLYYPHILPAIDTLVNRFLIEKSESLLKIHPLLKDYYYEKVEHKERIELHKQYAEFFENENGNGEKNNPYNLSNLIYHLAGSLQTRKLGEYKYRYIDEVKPIADQLYKDKNYADAVYYYNLVYEVTQELRQDVLIRMVQCFTYCDDLTNAEKFFSLAIKENKRGAYLWAQYSIALSSRRKNLKHAMQRAQEAEEVYQKYGNTLRWELGKIKFSLAKAQRYDNTGKAIELFKEAINLDPTNTYYICMYAKTLIESGDYDGGVEQLHRAEDIDPQNDLLQRFLHKYISSGIKEHETEIVESIEEDEADQDEAV